MLVKSKWINEFIPFPNESKYVLHDYWISLIISQSGKIGYLDKPTIKYRQHSNNKVGSKTKSEELESLDDVRNLFINVKIEHFETFIKHEKYFKDESFKILNKKALEYYNSLKSVKNIRFSGIGLFFKLYKYESFEYKMKNLAILHFPGLIRGIFNKMKEKQKREEEFIKQQKAEAALARKEKAQARKKAKIEEEKRKQEENSKSSKKKTSKKKQTNK
jgi:hypothetical protein